MPPNQFNHMAMWTWPDAVQGESAERIVERLLAAHIDTVIPYISLRGTTAERSAYDERLHALTDEAHRRGMQVVACFDEMGVYDACPAKDHAQINKDGGLAGSLCPADPVSRAFILGELEKALTRFEFDGINLEDSYVYNSNTIYDVAHAGSRAEYKVIPVCYCAYCRAHAPIERPEWAQWKRDRMSELVESAAALIRLKRPGIPFSVAARMPYALEPFYAPYESEVPYYNGWLHCQSRDGLSADWASWLRRGYIQYACPMSYFNTDRMIELETLECQSLFPNAKRDIWIGLGLDIITAEYTQAYNDNPDPSDKRKDVFKNDGVAIGRQLDLQLRLGQQNAVFFSHAFLKDEHIPVIARYRPASRESVVV